MTFSQFFSSKFRELGDSEEKYSIPREYIVYVEKYLLIQCKIQKAQNSRIFTSLFPLIYLSKHISLNALSGVKLNFGYYLTVDFLTCFLILKTRGFYRMEVLTFDRLLTQFCDF